MGSLDLAVELRRARLDDMHVADAFVFDMPMEQSLELMAPICANGMDAKRKLIDHVIYEINGVVLSMTSVDLQSPDPGGIIYGSVLETTDLPVLGVLESKECHINLDVVARNLLGIATGMNGPSTPS